MQSLYLTYTHTGTSTLVCAAAAAASSTGPHQALVPIDIFLNAIKLPMFFPIELQLPDPRTNSLQFNLIAIINFNY